jgi:predicted ArsR family transcriptional regulator
MADEESWDDRLRPMLSDQWQSADLIAARLGAKHHTVLARLKDMMRRNLVERRLVKKTAGRNAVQQAEFRRLPL